MQIASFHTCMKSNSRRCLRIVGLGARRFTREPELSEVREVGGEYRPLTVEENAAEVENALGSLASPPHAGAVGARAYLVSDGAFDDAAPDDEIIGPQLGIAYPLHEPRLPEPLRPGDPDAMARAATWKRLVAEWKSSGLTAVARGFAASTLTG